MVISYVIDVCGLWNLLFILKSVNYYPQKMELGQTLLEDHHRFISSHGISVGKGNPGQCDFIFLSTGKDNH